jgi:tRNA (mo5U34)-methyltransferase
VTPVVSEMLLRLQSRLETLGWHAWNDRLQPLAHARLADSAHGSMPKWRAAIEALPDLEAQLSVVDRFVCVDAATQPPTSQLVETLMQLHPWRKGPFRMFATEIDTEWRSDLKWNRIANRVDFRDAKILDIGCGNGYYGWRMLDVGADLVLGVDPTLLYSMQFAAFNRYDQSSKHFIVPAIDTELPVDGDKADVPGPFDLTFSMGVLYHRTAPIDHLRTLYATLRPGGTVIVETIVIDDCQETILVPQDRYAQMRNVWMIPSLPMLKRWLDRTGFQQIEVIDDCVTTTHEQRRTPWMTFHSLNDFLDPSDSSKTVEGYPAPRRAMVMARRG